MPGKRARSFSREFKEAAVLRVLTGEKVAAVAAALELKPQQVYRWWSQYDRGGAAALRPSGRPRKVGEQALVIDFFRRALRHVKARPRPNAGRGDATSSP